jgi:hypothetical protein
MSFDYKQKYQEMKSRLIEATDTAYRLGYEEGLKEGQVQAMQQQMQMQQQMAQQQAMMAQQGGDPNAQQMSPEEQAMMEQQGGGQEMSPEEQAMMEAQGGGQEMPEEMGQQTELDAKLAELESLVEKGEKPKILDLRKTIKEIASIRKSQIEKFNKKAEKTESAQRKVVKNILSKWSQDSKSVTEDLEKILQTEGLKLD